jgi:hypothetical protein
VCDAALRWQSLNADLRTSEGTVANPYIIQNCTMHEMLLLLLLL